MVPTGKGIMNGDKCWCWPGFAHGTGDVQVWELPWRLLITHRAGLHGHGCKLQLLEEAQPEVFSQEGGCKCACPGVLAGRGWGGGTWCTSGHTTSSSGLQQGGTSNWGEGREWVLGETGDREGHGASPPQNGCLSLPSPRGRCWLCVGLTGAPSLATPSACPHCCKAQHLSQPFPGCFSPRGKGKPQVSFLRNPASPCLCLSVHLASHAALTTKSPCPASGRYSRALQTPHLTVLVTQAAPPTPEMSSGRQKPNDA